MTEKQKAASRANGAKSKGPKTEAGRQRSSQNALKHGLSSGLVVLPIESEERFEYHRASYLDRFQPSDPVEEDLVEQMIAASWRLHRLWGMEKTALEKAIIDTSPKLEKEYKSVPDDARLCTAMQSLMEGPGFLSQLSRHESRLARLYHRALQDFLRLRESEARPSGRGAKPENKNTQIEPGDGERSEESVSHTQKTLAGAQAAQNESSISIENGRVPEVFPEDGELSVLPGCCLPTTHNRQP